MGNRAVTNIVNFKNKNALAYEFHLLAFPFLSEFNFELRKDPSIILSPLQVTQASYKSECGLYLSIGIDPFDSNIASIMFGRQWYVKGEAFCLSNKYTKFSDYYNLNDPLNYKLGYGDEITKTFDTIIFDLKESLPIIMNQLMLEDLINVEGELYGVIHNLITLFGFSIFEEVQVSNYKL